MSRPGAQLLHPHRRSTNARTEEETIRKIVAGLFISLDGVVESPANWAYQYFDDEMADVIGAGIAEADAVLLGRRTYLEFAELWPSQGSDVPMAAFLNNTPKYIVSSTLDTLDWAGSSLVSGDLAGEVAKTPGRTFRSPAARRWCGRCCATDCSMRSAS
jgi:hypothetical protein